MGHGHDHARSASQRALGIALALTASYTVVEVVGGILTGSLALLADAVHMLSDNVALGVALFAVWLATRPATPERTYGYKRAEVLAALANGVALVALAIWIFIAAFQRFDDPPEILGSWMLAIALVGVGVNIAADRLESVHDRAHVDGTEHAGGAQRLGPRLAAGDVVGDQTLVDW